jgi:hypothetical protein
MSFKEKYSDGKIRRYKQLLDDLEENRIMKFERGSIRSQSA